MNDYGPGAMQAGLSYLALAARIRRVAEARMAGGRLSLLDVKVLQAIDLDGPLRQSSLATGLGFTPRSITQAVQVMERDGLVTRSPAPGDHRTKLVHLTEAGAVALNTATAAAEEMVCQIFGLLSREQLARLEGLLNTLQSGIAVAAPSGPRPRAALEGA